MSEIWLSCQWHSVERKVVYTAIQVQREKPAALMLHPDRDVTGSLKAIGKLEKAGADSTSTIMSYTERTISNSCRDLEPATTIIHRKYDLFGHESSFYPLSCLRVTEDKITTIFCLTLYSE
jgi:phosphotriesterase-related protein